ncbi:LOW QUALITY PROTEIN: hypothetical protein PHMEG_00034884 [Phytophthora megakarya]|uniref:Uncharacterized protein n=1 Tax=Phytophthora megakarya TaxID=4795 RepID=A0A225USN4_9STRA|nr:LOW QUALITY PROTEIN: hypothetical protein PHMEG_00034884 [Phytophthora megakarya]
MIQQVWISAISDLKEKESGRGSNTSLNQQGQVGLHAEIRHQIKKKCLTFAHQLAGSAKNRYRQLSRSTRNNFPIQYCGLRVSVARQYYHARRRSDESQLDYLYQLNVVGLRVRLKIEDIPTTDLNMWITSLKPWRIRLDADDLEEVLRARDRAKRRRKKTAFGSGKFRQNASNAARSAPAKQVRAIQIQAIDFGSDTSDGSDVSISEMDSHRRIYLTANQEVAPKEEGETIMPDPGHQDPGSMNHIHQEHRSKIQNARFNHNRCSHCGSKKHSNLGCWRHVACTKCGK